MVRYDFAGKVVLVTGSSRGMGAAILEAFAAAGATCIVNYFDDPAGDNRRDADETADPPARHMACRSTSWPPTSAIMHRSRGS